MVLLGLCLENFFPDPLCVINSVLLVSSLTGAVAVKLEQDENRTQHVALSKDKRHLKVLPSCL